MNNQPVFFFCYFADCGLEQHSIIVAFLSVPSKVECMILLFMAARWWLLSCRLITVFLFLLLIICTGRLIVAFCFLLNYPG